MGASWAFGYAAMQGIASWRFEPALRGARKVPVRVRIPVNFRFSIEDNL